MQTLIRDECRTRFYIKQTSCENLVNFSEIRMQDFPLPLYITLANKLASLGASVPLAVESGHVHLMERQREQKMFVKVAFLSHFPCLGFLTLLSGAPENWVLAC